jgi:hypothetical protein
MGQVMTFEEKIAAGEYRNTLDAQVNRLAYQRRAAEQESRFMRRT